MRLIVGMACAVFLLQTVGLVLKLLHRNAWGWTDTASAALLVSAVVLTLTWQGREERRAAGHRRAVRAITVVCYALLAMAVLCCAIPIALSPLAGITHSKAPLLQRLPQYELFSHGKVTRVERWHYVATGICHWCAMVFGMTTCVLGLAPGAFGGPRSSENDSATGIHGGWRD